MFLVTLKKNLILPTICLGIQTSSKLYGSISTWLPSRIWLGFETKHTYPQYVIRKMLEITNFISRRITTKQPQSSTKTTTLITAIFNSWFMFVIWASKYLASIDEELAESMSINGIRIDEKKWNRVYYNLIRIHTS
jgi:hypothetical protein